MSKIPSGLIILLILYYQGYLVAAQRTDLCDSSSCSHLCLPDELETKYRCHCQHSEDLISLSDKNNGFCEDHTVLATYKNILYVVGLPDDDFSTPKIREHKINISSIAAITYDSTNGKVILTEVGQRKIHVWFALTGELKLILDEGPGTINSLAFDHYTNNLYWIDPKAKVIKAMNLGTYMKVDILKGNSSYVPRHFVLIPSTGYIAVLFQRKGLFITIEYGISMDGISDNRQILLEDKKILHYDMEDLILYYVKENRTICLLDREANTIRYFSIDGSPELPSSRPNDGFMSKIRSLAFVKNSIVWSEEDLVIQKAQVTLNDLVVSRPGVPKINLVQSSATDYSDTTKNGVFRLFGIERQIEIPDHAGKCLQNNGGCRKVEMCLLSTKHSQVSCVRPVGGYGRIKQLQSTQSEVNMTRTLSEALTQSEMDTNRTLSVEANLGSVISHPTDSSMERVDEYLSDTNITLGAYTIIYFPLIVSFATLVSIMGYLFLRIIYFVKKRIASNKPNSRRSIPLVEIIPST